MLKLDGSYGEGGGQILRTAFSLSCITGKPVEIYNIRAARKKPGLQPQHLTGVLGCAEIARAEVVGAELNSTRLVFIPKKHKGGEYLFDVEKTVGKGSAGSITLLLQAILLPLCLANGPSRLILRGGTHVTWSPSFHFFNEVLLPTLRKTGIQTHAELKQWGFYPIGKGEVSVEITPVKRLMPLQLENRGNLKRISGLSAAANLPAHIAQRQKEAALNLLRNEGYEADIEIVEAAAIGRGTFCFINPEFENGIAGFGALGEIHKRAETVGEEAARAFLDYMKSGAAVDLHLADQILPYLALAEGSSSYTTQEITRHLLTNIWVVQQFLEREIRVEGELKQAGRVTIS